MFNRLKNNVVRVLVVVAAVLCFSACREDINTDNRYTFVGQTVADYLTEHEDMFSDFIYILQHGERWNLMKAYGTYTCFAPTNEAVERFLVEQDSIWRASLEPGSKRERWTGVTSPVLEELSDSMCRELANSHLLNSVVETTSMEGDVLPAKNMNSRYLTMRYDTDENLHSVFYINEARLLMGDEEVENGIVHVMGGVLNPSAKTVPLQISDMPFLAIFYTALCVTGYDKEMQLYKDETYEQVPHPAGFPYPRERYYGYSAFCEPDEVFNNYGIFNVDDLAEKCKEWYPDAKDPDYTSKDNALNKFVAYHLMNRRLLYSRMVCYNIIAYDSYNKPLFHSEVMFKPTTERTEFYETMQHTILKFSRPLDVSLYKNDLLLNYSKAHANPEDPYHCPAGTKGAMVNVRIKEPTSVTAQPDLYPNYNQDALNGCVYLLDDVLVYDEEVMTGFVCNQIIRFSFSKMIPEMDNCHILWENNPDYPSGQYYNVTGIPPGYSDAIKFNYDIDANLRFAGNSEGVRSYEAEEWFCGHDDEIGSDISFRLPPVPPGTYEIRQGYSIYGGFGTAQFYVDDIVTGIPVDMSLTGSNPKVNWIADKYTDDNGVANDKQMKNRGYLKGPSSFYIENGSNTARGIDGCLRLVLTTKYLGPGEHWLRFKGRPQLQYLEMVPVGYLRREDISIEEKRK